MLAVGWSGRSPPEKTVSEKVCSPQRVTPDTSPGYGDGVMLFVLCREKAHGKPAEVSAVNVNWNCKKRMTGMGPDQPVSNLEETLQTQ